MRHPLDNPIWESLNTRHAAHAQVEGPLRRYPRDVGPFVGIAAPDGGKPTNEAALARLIPAGDQVYFVGFVPDLSDLWIVEPLEPMPQLVCTEPIKVPEGPQIIELDERHHADMLALTQLVYPGYFRERTPAIGNYIGIYQNGQLAAMGGERMYCHDYQEMSAICTHPNHLGRGYAQRILGVLTNRTLGRGETPFLHVSRQNTRARAVYDHLGYRERASLPFFSVRRR